MNTPLQTAPRALLGALEAKVQGQNPIAFGDTLQPGIEVFDLYLSDRTGVAVDLVTVATPAVNGQAVEGPLTAGITWRVLAVGALVNFANAADNAIDVRLSINARDPSNVGCPILVQEFSGLFNTKQLGLYLGRPFWLPPGWFLTADAELAAVPAGNWDIGLRVLFNRVVE